MYKLISLKRTCRIINKIIPDCFDLPLERCGNNIQSTQTILRRAGVPCTGFEQHIDVELFQKIRNSTFCKLQLFKDRQMAKS
ncbi:unnamed protein product [Gongylonema pulchrum]|uniref:Uncharacterized protein n=1 Tax=Gongylonema pulchrum TaxID=637853 RepID=A0A183EFT5_9BILA|nr:unnamed protein product [Gongylonema pulchrum]